MPASCRTISPNQLPCHVASGWPAPSRAAPPKPSFADKCVPKLDLGNEGDNTLREARKTPTDTRPASSATRGLRRRIGG